MNFLYGPDTEKTAVILDEKIMPSSHAQFCEKWLAAWTGNRPDNLLSFYDANAFYRDPQYPQGLKGHKEIFPYFKKLLAKNPHWEWKAQEIIPIEKGFVLKWKAQFLLDKGVHQEEGLDIVELNDQNKIYRNEVFFDRTHLLSKKKGEPRHVKI